MKIRILILFYLFGLVGVDAATLIVNWSVATDPVRRLCDRLSIPLSAGTSTSGDGTLVQLGYYDQATIANPFAGKWIVLSSTTMGDDGVEIAGKFATTTTLGNSPFLAPADGVPLAVRFYNGTSLGDSTYYNAVSNKSGTWNFVGPNDIPPVIDIIIDKSAAIVFQNVGGAFATWIPIPEPSCILLMTGGLVAIFKRKVI